MSITKGLRAWLNTYDGLAGDRINVDCLPEDQSSYSLDSDPEYFVKPYLDGSQQVERTFVLASCEAFGDDIIQNTEILDWYEDLSSWIRLQSRRRNFPDIGTGKKVSSVSVASTPYPFVVYDNGMARYQIQIKLIYTEE